MPAQAIATSGTAAIAPEPSPRRMLEVEQRLLAEALEQPAMAGLGRAVADEAVVERAAVDRACSGSAAAVTT